MQRTRHEPKPEAMDLSDCPVIAVDEMPYGYAKSERHEQSKKAQRDFKSGGPRLRACRMHCAFQDSERTPICSQGQRKRLWRLMVIIDAIPV